VAKNLFPVFLYQTLHKKGNFYFFQTSIQYVVSSKKEVNLIEVNWWKVEGLRAQFGTTFVLLCLLRAT